MDDRDLTRYQVALLELLHQGPPPEVRAAALRVDPAFRPYRAYVISMDPGCLDVGVDVVQKWARRRKTLKR